MANRSHNFKDITGRAFGQLTVVALHSVKKKEPRWVCTCSCGVTTVKRGANIKRGLTTSCGCRALASRRISKGESGFNKLLLAYRVGARKRNLSFDLTNEQFRLLTQQNCHYCGVAPSQTIRVVNQGRTTEDGAKYSEYTYNGVDRQDNLQGYTLPNSVACCQICNRAKSSISYEEFTAYIERIRNGR